MSSKTLYYFTESFPYGLGETWKLNELTILIKEFEQIHVIPLVHHGNEDNPKKLHENITVHKPLIGVSKKRLYKSSLLMVFDRNFFYYFKDFIKKKVFLDNKKIIKWLLTIVRIKQLLKHPKIKELINNDDPNSFYYFFWGIGSADIIPFLNKTMTKKILVRMHRFDLFENEVGNYIPFRSSLLKYSSIVAPSSQAGESHLRELYPNYSEKIQFKMLGVQGRGITNQLHDDILRIVTVSYIVPVKRLNILALSLKHYPKKIEWTHLGDGPLRNELEMIIKTFPLNVKVSLKGMIDSTKVLDVLIDLRPNLFLNISESEGIPFSIMESLSAGIPVMATDVGGTSEIINDSVGKLLPKELTPETLQKELIKYSNLSKEEKELRANNAYSMYITKCNSETLTKKLAADLKSLRE